MKRTILLLGFALSLLAAALSITTTSLPSAVRGVAYNQTLAATGGTAPYTWTIAEGTLCDDLTLSEAGVISGTPSTGQTCSFTVQVADSAAVMATQALSIIVRTPSTSISGGVTFSGGVTIR